MKRQLDPRRLMTVVSAICALFLAAVCIENTEAKAERPRAQRMVFSVETVTVRVMESFPEQLHIEAVGTASTGGWTNPQLRLRKKEPADGIYEFEFVAQPPEGIATQALTAVRAVVTMPKPKGFRGVRVIATTNQREEQSGGPEK